MDNSDNSRRYKQKRQQTKTNPEVSTSISKKRTSVSKKPLSKKHILVEGKTVLEESITNKYSKGLKYGKTIVSKDEFKSKNVSKLKTRISLLKKFKTIPTQTKTPTRTFVKKSSFEKKSVAKLKPIMIDKKVYADTIKNRKDSFIKQNLKSVKPKTIKKSSKSIWKYKKNENRKTTVFDFSAKTKMKDMKYSKLSTKVRTKSSVLQQKKVEDLSKSNLKKSPMFKIEVISSKIKTKLLDKQKKPHKTSQLETKMTIRPKQKTTKNGIKIKKSIQKKLKSIPITKTIIKSKSEPDTKKGEIYVTQTSPPSTFVGSSPKLVEIKKSKAVLKLKTSRYETELTKKSGRVKSKPEELVVKTISTDVSILESLDAPPMVTKYIDKSISKTKSPVKILIKQETSFNNIVKEKEKDPFELELNKIVKMTKEKLIETKIRQTHIPYLPSIDLGKFSSFISLSKQENKKFTAQIVNHIPTSLTMAYRRSYQERDSLFYRRPDDYEKPEQDESKMVRFNAYLMNIPLYTRYAPEELDKIVDVSPGLMTSQSNLVRRSRTQIYRLTNLESPQLLPTIDSSNDKKTSLGVATDSTSLALEQGHRQFTIKSTMVKTKEIVIDAPLWSSSESLLKTNTMTTTKDSSSNSNNLNFP